MNQTHTGIIVLGSTPKSYEYNFSKRIYFTFWMTNLISHALLCSPQSFPLLCC
jgi:hypothetical protein